MFERALTPRWISIFISGYLIVHGTALWVFPKSGEALGLVFNNLAPLLALLCCGWRAWRSSTPKRLLWILLSAGLVLWVIGMAESAWEVLIENASVAWASSSDFFFFLYGVPVLLAISVPAEDRNIPLFLGLDSVQALLAACLSYIAIFSVVPFTAAIHPISEEHLAAVYNIENFVLAVAASLRLAANPIETEERNFFRKLCVFLWFYAVFAGLYNYLTVRFQLLPSSLITVLADVPFLILAGTVLLPPRRSERSDLIEQKSPLALLIENASPILYTSGLLMLGAVIVPTHFSIGISSILIGLMVYGIRTAILQMQLVRSREALRRANDRLEEISLLDGLTGVANRRNFEITLEVEWNRATRSESPLALLMMDVDYFKNLNDTRGHRYGDACLVEIADVLRRDLPRSGDFVARFGGEEFAVLLPATNQESAGLVAERLRQAVLARQIRNESAIGAFVSISIGVAVYEQFGEGAAAGLVEASDRALYRAKQNGRNCVERYAEVALPKV